MCMFCRAGTAYPSGAHEFTPVFRGVRVTQSLVLYVRFVDRCLSFYPFSFGHCVVCPSFGHCVVCPSFGHCVVCPSFGHCVVCVFLRFTDSDFPFGIFKLFQVF